MATMLLMLMVSLMMLLTVAVTVAATGAMVTVRPASVSTWQAAGRRVALRFELPTAALSLGGRADGRRGSFLAYNTHKGTRTYS